MSIEILGTGFDYAVQNVMRFAYGLTWHGQKNGGAAWSVGNCLITVRVVTEMTSELELVHFRKVPADNVANAAWVELVDRLQRAGIAHPCTDLERIARKSLATMNKVNDERITRYKKDPLRYRADCMAKWRKEWELPGLTVTEEGLWAAWRKHVYELARQAKELRKLRQERAALANKTPEQAAAEFFESLRTQSVAPDVPASDAGSWMSEPNEKREAILPTRPGVIIRMLQESLKPYYELFGKVIDAGSGTVITMQTPHQPDAEHLHIDFALNSRRDDLSYIERAITFEVMQLGEWQTRLVGRCYPGLYDMFVMIWDDALRELNAAINAPALPTGGTGDERRMADEKPSGGVIIGNVSGGITNSIIASRNVTIGGASAHPDKPLVPVEASPTEKLAKLHQNIAAYFGDEELRSLCFDLGVDYADLPAEGKDGKARELVAHMERRRRIPELVEVCRKLRHNSEW